VRIFVSPLLIVLLVFLAIAPDRVQAEDRVITLGTAGVTGVYYPAGGAICRLLNRARKEHGIRCSAESTGGSIANLIALHDGELDFAIVQSDWQYHAYHGTHEFAQAGPNAQLRFVFSLHSEPFTVLVRDKSAIQGLDDLKGKRINIGAPDSGSNGTMHELMRVKGWDESSFEQILEFKSTDQMQALCDNTIDALVFSSGHPNGALQDATMLCKTRLISIEGDEIDKLIADNPFYAYATIPGGMYQNNPQDTKTFGVKATLVSTANEDSDVVYELTKAVFTNFESFKTLHPVFATLDPVHMISEGNSAPMHDGAARYFSDAGMISVAPPAAPAEKPVSPFEVKPQ